MRRLASLPCWLSPPLGRAEQFDYYTHPVLSKAVADGTLKEVKELTSDQIGEFTSALPDSPSAFLVVATNDKRFAKLLVQPARQKVGRQAGRRSCWSTSSSRSRGRPTGPSRLRGRTCTCTPACG